MIFRSIFFSVATSAGLAGPVIVPAGSQPNFSLTMKPPVGLSGLAWVRDDLYFAVSDRERAIVPLRLRLDPASGAITAGRIEPMIPVRTKAADFEDIVCDAAGGRVFISMEGPPGIEAFTFAGKSLGRVKLPDVFSTARKNTGMECLTRDAASGRAWTANQDTLNADGEVSSDKAGGLVRLQEFDAAMRPRRQFAWRTELSAYRIGGHGTGVTALCLLPDGNLVVMERAVARLTLEVRLFLAGFQGATDTSAIPALEGAAFTPAKKMRLFRWPCGITNFEGMAAGPLLNDGSRSLILVADSGSGALHQFLALRIRM
jgi:hypothetical protein